MNFVPYTLHLRGSDLVIDHPLVMGILNATPDSFYAGSRTFTTAAMEERVQQMVAEGADMIDIGAYSTRPGAAEVDADEELRRLERGIEVVKRLAPHLPISIDTFRASVARKCVTDLGAHIINDV
ncbi:MAG: dihydropteroate synthase, partial [Sodaliphilus sp.]